MKLRVNQAEFNYLQEVAKELILSDTIVDKQFNIHAIEVSDFADVIRNVLKLKETFIAINEADIPITQSVLTALNVNFSIQKEQDKLYVKAYFRNNSESYLLGFKTAVELIKRQF